MSEKDKEDILFGIRQDIDFVAASFTRTAEDVMQIRKLLDENGEKISISSQRSKMRKVWIRSMRSSAYRMEL